MKKHYRLFFLVTLLHSFAAWAEADRAQVGLKKKTLSIDCTFTGPTGEWCEQESKTWAQLENLEAQGITLKVHRAPITNSTKKLAQFEKRLSSKDPTLEIFGIDVVWSGLLHKYLTDLDPPFSEQLKFFHPSLLQANTVNGRILGIPMAIGNGLLFYRKDLLEKYKLAPPKTWEELFQISKEILEKENSKTLTGFAFQGATYEGLTCNFLEWIAGFGASQFIDDHGLVLFNTTPVIRALEFFKTHLPTLANLATPKESAKKSKSKIPSEQKLNSYSLIALESLRFHEKESYEFFKKGNAIFLRAWPSAWPMLQESGSAVKDKTGVTLIPKSKNNPLPGHPSTLGGWSFAVASHTVHKELAYKLIGHLTSQAVQQRRAKMYGIVPTIPELLKDADVIQAAPYVKLHQTGEPTTMTPVIRPAHLLRNTYPEVSKIIWTEVHQFLKGGRTPQETATRLQEQVSRQAKRWRK